MYHEVIQRRIIKSFRGSITEAVFNGECPKGFPADIMKVARRKLRYLNAATRLEDLKGDRAGQHSIRVNDKVRVCFTWTSEGPTGVEIIDYH